MKVSSLWCMFSCQCSFLCKQIKSVLNKYFVHRHNLVLVVFLIGIQWGGGGGGGDAYTLISSTSYFIIVLVYLSISS